MSRWLLSLCFIIYSHIASGRAAFTLIFENGALLTPINVLVGWQMQKITSHVSLTIFLYSFHVTTASYIVNSFNFVLRPWIVITNELLFLLGVKWSRTAMNVRYCRSIPDRPILILLTLTLSFKYKYKFLDSFWDVVAINYRRPYVLTLMFAVSILMFMF